MYFPKVHIGFLIFIDSWYCTLIFCKKKGVMCLLLNKSLASGKALSDWQTQITVNPRVGAEVTFPLRPAVERWVTEQKQVLLWREKGKMDIGKAINGLPYLITLLALESKSDSSVTFLLVSFCWYIFFLSLLSAWLYHFILVISLVGRIWLYFGFVSLLPLNLKVFYF